MARQLAGWIKRARGFTLIEMMVTVAIVGILSAIAVPSYNAYVMRSRTVEATSVLASFGTGAEQYWANNRTFGSIPGPAPTANFNYVVSATPNTYTVTANGKNKMLGLVYTIDQAGTKTTTTTGNFATWGNSATCWVDRRGGQCTE